MTAIRTFSVLLAVLLGTGCYHYVPVTTLAYPQGTPLRAHLGALSAFELPAMTVNNIGTVEGELVSVDGGDVVLSATWLEAVTGNGYAGNGWTVRIPEANMTTVERKRFSWWRTGVIVAALTAGTWIGFDALGVNFGGDTGGGGGGPPQ